ncbi:MAG: aminotransferase class I/II-fold pyridoxal phosphate-dependent enzyme [Myxococcales bacterium]|nr:MAG: aminotransferase class I/II-fold pyridoxal phosphate-dependent enzyme [Myxococcales bacterium]
MAKRETVRVAERVKTLPPYLFARIDQLRNEARRKGVDVIDLGVGDPDEPTPAPIVAAMQRAAADPANHKYPAYEGSFAFRKSCADYLKKRLGAALDPASEILALIGSKEGIGHLPLAFVDPGDLVLVPDPGYPVYAIATRFCGGEPHFMPLRAENGFMPDLSRVPAKAWNRAKILWLNYPNNPTGARATREFFLEAIRLCAKYGVLLAHDAAYFEIYAGRERPLSILELPGGREVGVEFYSFSKTFNMTGWRIGFAAGQAAAINALGRVKNNLDSGAFTAVQQATVAGNARLAALIGPIRRLYAGRRKETVKAMQRAGFDVFDAGATFYIWTRTPAGSTSAEFAMRALAKAGVVVTPGTGFGPSGEGYFRVALCAPQARILEGVRRLAAVRG